MGRDQGRGQGRGGAQVNGIRTIRRERINQARNQSTKSVSCRGTLAGVPDFLFEKSVAEISVCPSASFTLNLPE